ncbi:MAG TPA: TonB-dependent receptor [Terriglobia bacterium]|nr:TonB-dependent receptor [Terriglobia bacterium]
MLAACLVAWAVLACIRLNAQVSTGSISATVVDSSGGAIPRARVSAVRASTGQTYAAMTDSTGNFRLASLAVGEYNLRVSKAGFATLAVRNIIVRSAVDAGLGRLTLSLGAVTTTVHVTGAAALLQTTQAQVSATLSSSFIDHFPGVNENEGMDNLALLLPGVANSRDDNFSNANGMAFTSNGMRGRDNDQQIDGQFNNDNSVAGPALFLSNSDFVQDYQVITDNFGPEYGRNSGSVVNIITKSGTNQYHGDAYVTEGNAGLDTLSNTQIAFEGLTKLPYFNDEFSGASFGGPIKKDKAFFFGGFDDEIVPSSEVYATGNLTPTATGLSELGACPYANPASLAALSTYGPYGVKGGSPVPSGTPTTESFTDPFNAAVSCPVEMDGVQRALPTPSHEYDGIVKVDLNGTKDHGYGRWIYQKITQVNVDSFGTAAAGYPVNLPSFSEAFGLSWSHILTPTQVNEVRLSYGREVVQFGGNAIGDTVPNQGSLSSALANINMPSGFLGFGPATTAPQGRVVNSLQVQDNWSYLHGNHQMKAGWNYTNQRSPNVFLPNYNGEFTYASFADYIANSPSTVNVALGNPDLPFHENDHFLYFGDDYKARPNLTLNLGVTYSYFGQPADLFHQITVANETSNAPFFDPSLPLSIRTSPDLPSVKDDFGPSAGFAYSPNWLGAGKTVVRGGYRLIFDPPFYSIYNNIATSAPVVLLQTLTGATAAANPLPAAPFGPAVRSELASSLTLGVADPRSFNQTNTTPNFSPDQVSEWSFGIQRALSQNLVFEGRYVGNHGSDLFQSINANPDIAGIYAAFPNVLPSNVNPCPASQAVVPTAVGRVNCDEGVVRTRNNAAYSDYQGLQLNLRATNLKNQLSLLTSYTWSKTTDNTSEIFGTFAGGNSLAFSQDPLNYLGAEHGLSGLDIPQDWTVSFYEALPFFRGQPGLVGHLLGGWGVSGSCIISSGQPYTPVQFGENVDSGGNYFDTTFDSAFAGTLETARPFAVNSGAPASAVGMFAGDACTIFSAGCGLPANTLLDFNTLNASGGATVNTTSERNVRFIVNGAEADSVFKSPFGAAGRNILRDWYTNSANFSIFKTFRISESKQIQFSATALNVFNVPNFSSVDPFIDDAGLASEDTGFAIPQLFSGATINASQGQRIIKFGLKLFF